MPEGTGAIVQVGDFLGHRRDGLEVRLQADGFEQLGQQARMRTLFVFLAQLAIEVARERRGLVHIGQVDQQVGRIAVQAEGAEPLVTEEHLELRAGGRAGEHVLRHRVPLAGLRGDFLFETLLEILLGQRPGKIGGGHETLFDAIDRPGQPTPGLGGRHVVAQRKDVEQLLVRGIGLAVALEPCLGQRGQLARGAIDLAGSSVDGQRIGNDACFFDGQVLQLRQGKIAGIHPVLLVLVLDRHQAMAREFACICSQSRSK